jgi:DNA-binding transcriptional MerR regulator
MEGYFTESETAEKLGVAVHTLRVWACRRKGPPRTKVGRSLFYRANSLHAWLAGHETSFETERAA